MKVDVAARTAELVGAKARKTLAAVADRIAKTYPERNVHVTESTPPAPGDQRTFSILWKQEAKNEHEAVKEAAAVLDSHRRPGGDALPRMIYKADQRK